MTMYAVEEIKKPTGKSAIIVKRNQRLVGAASMPFIRWMHEHVPSSQLSPEQAAMVKWFEQNKVH
jgi:hypothetical protein